MKNVESVCDAPLDDPSTTSGQKKASASQHKKQHKEGTTTSSAQRMSAYGPQRSADGSQNMKPGGTPQKKRNLRQQIIEKMGNSLPALPSSEARRLNQLMCPHELTSEAQHEFGVNLAALPTGARVRVCQHRRAPHAGILYLQDFLTKAELDALMKGWPSEAELFGKHCDADRGELTHFVVTILPRLTQWPHCPLRRATPSPRAPPGSACCSGHSKALPQPEASPQKPHTRHGRLSPRPR
eukprot:7391075-Prymnesium_polylepis.1